MPTFRFLFIILALFHGYTFGQLKWSNPQPSGYICRKVVFTDATNGFILNYNGDLIKTRNQGATWEVDHNFSDMGTLDMHDSTGILAGASGIVYLSNDNGNTWQKKATGFNTYFSMTDIVSRDTIFMVGLSKIYKSNNRGQTWQMLNYSGGVISFDFINSSIGYVGTSGGVIYKTIDGGQTWQQTTPTLNTSNSGIMAVKFRNADTGYAFRDDDSLLKTTNGGITWTKRRVPGDIMTMNFPNDSVGFVAGEDGALYRTTNAGNTWTWISPTGFVGAMGLYSLSFITADTGFAVGHRGRILKTTNRGASWQPYSPTYIDVTALSFTGSSTGYATTWNNCYKTTDGAKTWAPLSLTVGNAATNNYSRFQQAHFFSPDTGLVTASLPPRIYKTTNGGQSWRTIAPYGSNLFDYNTGISFVNDSTAFLNMNTTTGYYALYKTKDKGETWKKIDSNRVSNETFSLIQFLNERTGYAVRYNLLYKTKDSAKTWSVLPTNSTSQIQALWFANARTGFVGYSQGMKRTVDSGNTWANVSFGNTSADVRAIKFINNQVGFVTMNSGAIYRSVDSGRTWLPYSKTAYYACSTIAFAKDSLTYFGGVNGTIASVVADTGYGTSANCPGNSFTFLSDKIGNFDIYQWQVDTGTGFINIANDVVHSGVTTTMLTIYKPPTAWANYTYRCAITDFTGTLYSQVHRLKFQTQWTGAIDSAWENPGNWSCGNIPDSNTDVVITSGTVVVQSNASIRSLQLSPGVVFTVKPGFLLTILH